MRGLRHFSARFDAVVEAALGRHPVRRRGLVVLGFSLLLAVGLASAGIAVAFGGRSQEIVYATRGGEIVALEPVSGESYGIHARTDDGGYATTPSRAGGSRSLAYAVLRGEGERLRADAYSADLVRGTRARLTTAPAGRAFLFPEFSERRARISAEVYGRDAAPNVAAGPSSGAERRYLLGTEAARSGAGLLSPVWISDDALYAWRVNGDDGATPIVAHDLLERRQVALGEPGSAVFGPPAYHPDSNTLVYAERPGGAPLRESRLRLRVGTAERELRGADSLGLYDPSLPVPSLGGKLAVMWTDGAQTGVGMLDPVTWTFGKTGLETRAGARYPQVSRDGTMVAVAEGDAISVRELDGGETLRVVRDAQRSGEPLDRLREAGYDVPPEARALARPSFVWRSLEDG